MLDDAPSLEGWDSGFVDGAARDEAIDRAFDYRGDVTLGLADGTKTIGYLYNRDRDVAEPFVQLFELDGARRTIAYASIQWIRFTGRDTAAGNSYAAWRRSREASRAASTPPDA